jgi:hypothetical protein
VFAVYGGMSLYHLASGNMLTCQVLGLRIELRMISNSDGYVKTDLLLFKT